MIYTSIDYLDKYIDVFGYIFMRAIEEKYSFNYIESVISHSKFVEELEQSNITTIAFTSKEKIYQDLFPQYDNPGLIYSPYDVYGWMGYVYLYLFLKYQVTFEMLFIVLPISKCMSMYKLYHEMDIVHMFDFFKESIKYTYLDCLMNNRNISSNELSNRSGMSFATINSLRYGKRDIDKLESIKLFKLSLVLRVKVTSLLTNLSLSLDEEM